MAELRLKNGKVLIVSDIDYDRCSKRHWYRQGSYVATSINGEDIYLHHFILGVDTSVEIDHKNRNKDDYTRENLRICTHSQNCANRSPQSNCKLGVKGVSWHRGKYRAVIRINRKNIDLGRSKSLREAAEMYNRGAVKYFGEFAYQNDLEAIHA